MTTFRWNVGPASDAGLHCLKLSVRLVRRLWPGCRYVVRHNSLSDRQRGRLPDVELVDGADHLDAFPFPPRGPAWKLYPPRVAPDDHEIIIDNDLILYRRPALVEEFLSRSDMILGTQEPTRAYNGPLSELIPAGFHLNSGLLCLPPGFDLGGLLRAAQTDPWGEGHLDEQTAVAYVLSRQPGFRFLPFSEVTTADGRYLLGASGVHFVGLNKGPHPFWRRFAAHLSLM